MGLCFLPASWCFAGDNESKQASGPTSDISSHAVRSAKLRETMNNLEKLMLERMYTQLEMDRRSQRHTKIFAETALELERSAGYIPDALEEVDLTSAQQQEFLNLADQLRTQASELREQASHASVAELRHSLDRITATCSSCHSQFRLSPLPK